MASVLENTGGGGAKGSPERSLKRNSLRNGRVERDDLNMIIKYAVFRNGISWSPF